jgi:hypothetical protein
MIEKYCFKCDLKEGNSCLKSKNISIQDKINKEKKKNKIIIILIKFLFIHLRFHFAFFTISLKKK